MRTLEAWMAIAVALVVAAAGACLLAHGVMPRYAVLWWVPIVPAAAALVVLLVVWSGVRAQREAANEQRLAVDAQREENERSQQAILRLLDELSSLADGDLTVQATVTEDITGAIADSINYAVDALRGLVTTINGSAIQLDSATRQTQSLSQHLAKMRAEGLLATRREAQTVYYRIADPNAARLLALLKSIYCP